MEKILEKLTAYNIFTNLLPGVIFCYLADLIYGYEFVTGGLDLIVALFIYYFVGLVISRLGSIVLEPVLAKSGVVKYATYEQFLEASAVDPKLDILLEVNNTLRSLLSAVICVGFLWVYERIISVFPTVEAYKFGLILGITTLLLVLAYRKQTSYIKQRSERDHEETRGQS